VDEIKAFLSVQEDDLRPLYEAHKKVKRRCVFVGTTNRDDYLRDETGGRRFWPLKVTRPINLAAVIAERSLWFAEALHRVEAGERWHLDDDRENSLAAVEQDARYEEDIWFGTIREYLAPENRAKDEPPQTTGTEQMSAMLNKKKAGDFVTSMQIAEHALKIEIKNARTTEGVRINKILRKLGWTPARTNIERGWRRPDTRSVSG
jgi:predicted P-loop ATPase